MDQAILTNPNVRAELEQLSDLPTAQQHQTIIEWLLGGDAGFHAAALEIIIRIGKPAMSLLREVFAKGRPPGGTNHLCPCGSRASLF